ncbi:Elongator subunit elp2 [Malassezia vespertilionis]|uniref:Elongator subunit elp2 n=1 Tax=Malassezia vespertilionis TaxID=2020962 RepID=UPI0024B23BF1|nr:Elongator subunit elp2 [Malassezia vespertilionis]WFD06633.1 Elongator subunit elp2 [Malassezia vespertilionis]
MTEVPVSFEYLSCATNRTSHIADCIELAHDDHFVAAYVFGVHKAFAVQLDPTSARSLRGIRQPQCPQPVHLQPTGFTSTVHVLKAIPFARTNPALLLGSYNGGTEIWRPVWKDERLCWECSVSLQSAEKSSITALGVLRNPACVARNVPLFATGSTDGTVQVYEARADGAEAQHVQEISLGSKYPLDIAFVHMPGPLDAPPTTLMAIALTDKQVHLYAREPRGAFRLRLQLDGHEDWVRALDFTTAPDLRTADSLNVYLASASQDQNVRLWRMSMDAARAQTQAPVRDTFEAMANELVPNDQGINTKKEWITFDNAPRWAVSLDALLLGHEAWVTGIRWHPTPSPASQRAALLSSSMDNSMIIWSPQALQSSAWPMLASSEAEKELWLPVHRFGDVGSLSGGFLGALWQPVHEDAPSTAVCTYDRQGAAHIWHHTDQGPWKPIASMSGHAGPASGLAWEPCGDYFLTTGADRTTRLHGTFVEHSVDGIPPRSWHELARPQTHGYDLHAVAWLDRLSFVSAADEKVLRVFGAPRSFIENAISLRTIQTHTKHMDVVMVELKERDAWRQGDALLPAIRCAMQARRPAMSILVSSAMLSGFASNKAPACSLGEVETFLNKVYTLAWSEASAASIPITDMNVYLVPGHTTSPENNAALRSWASTRASMVQGIYTVDNDAFRVPAASVALVSSVPATAVAAGSMTLSQVTTSHEFPREATVALGGTFDHIHIGHKLLLSISALCTTTRLIVGVTATELLASKKHRAYVEPIAKRLASVRHFLREFTSTLRPLALDVVPIADVCGPAGTDPLLDLLVVTQETAKGADTIAKVREENNIKAVQVHIVTLVDSGALEKVGSTAIREMLASSQVEPGTEYTLDVQLAKARETGPAAAGVPPLGLSNRAVAEDGEESAFFVQPPTPEQLQGHTLWPELEKLYGHGYEVLSVDVDLGAHLVASTCKATSAEHAVVRLFDAEQRWKPLQPPLDGHTLSITQTRFSSDGQYILTASRDRSWRLYRREDRTTYTPYTGERTHARIVWDCAWAWDAVHTFATASRDKTVKVWRVLDDEKARHELVTTIAVNDAVLSVAFGPHNMLAMGLERGDVLIYRANADQSAWTPYIALLRHHTGAVHRLGFRPYGAWVDAYNAVPLELLSVGDDGCARLVAFPL